MRTVKKNVEVVYPELSYTVSGILFDVRKELGRDCNEKQYCDAIEAKLKEKGIKYEREKTLPISLEGESRGRNQVDFLIEGKIILEVKSKPFITKNDYYQTRRYLKASGLRLAIVANMRRYYIHPKRVLNPEAEDSTFA